MKNRISRNYDIVPVNSHVISITIDDQQVDAMPGETLLSLLFAVGKKAICKNDHGKEVGAYCGMGVCHCCHVNVNGKNKIKACQTIATEGMTVYTLKNRIEQGVLK